MNHGKIIVPVLMVLVGACQGSAPTNNQSSRAASADPASTALISADDSQPIQPAEESVISMIMQLESKLKKGMPYAELRKVVMAEGWSPIVESECKRNVGGEASICDELPELESCSSDGYCVMWFAHDASKNKFHVGTYGDYSRWNTPVEQAALAVRFWEFSATADKVEIACPSQNFKTFLQAFASDPQVRKAFTLQTVKVVELVDVDGDYETRIAAMNRSEYEGFNLHYANGGFHVVDAAGKIDPNAIAVDIQTEAAGGYLVSYRYGMSEGNSYRFRQQQGCWYLAEDPEPPSP